MVTRSTDARPTLKVPRLAAARAALSTGLHWPDPWRLAGVLVILVVVPWPLWLVLSQGSTLTGYAEESTGYRYFHTLRLLYGDHERPLLPQGHIVGLVHMGIQMMLTVLGYPPTQLFPRVDIWAYTATLLPLFVAVPAYLWAVRPLSGPGRFSVALMMLTVIYQLRSSTFWHLLQPDYYAWAHALALVAIGLLIRLARRTEPVTLRDAILIGLFAGACISVKVTWVTFPSAVAALMMVRTASPLSVQSLLRALVFGTVVGGMAGLVFLGVLFMYHQMDAATVQDHLVQQNRFLGQATFPTPFAGWLTERITRLPPDIITLSMVSPAVLAVSVLLLRERMISLALLPGTVIAVYVAFQRPYSPTLVETNSYFFVVLVVWSTTVVMPQIRRLAEWFHARESVASFACRIVGGVGGAALLATVPYAEMYATRPALTASFAVSTTLTRRIDEFMHKTPGKTAFLILDNMRRPMTIHSGLAKAGGGTSVFDMTWGVSPLINEMFPDEAYFFDRLPTGRIDLAPFDKIVFGSAGTPTVSAQAAIPATWTLLNDVYGAAPLGFECTLIEDMSRYSYLTPAAIVGCVRRPDRRWNGRSQAPVLAIPREGVIAEKPVTINRRGSTHTVEDGDIIFSMVPNGVWRLDDDEGFRRLLVPAGTKVKVENSGPWNLDRNRFEGLTIVSEGNSHWTVEPPAARAINRNAHFERPGTSPLGDGWWMSAGPEAYTAERLTDEHGPFVRIRATQPLPHLLLTGADGFPNLDEVPATLRAQIRTVPGGMQTLTVYDFDQRGEPTVYADREVADGEWATLSLQVVRPRGNNPSDNYTIGIVGVKDGDWFDVREFGLFLGLLWGDGEIVAPPP